MLKSNNNQASKNEKNIVLDMLNDIQLRYVKLKKEWWKTYEKKYPNIKNEIDQIRRAIYIFSGRNSPDKKNLEIQRDQKIALFKIKQEQDPDLQFILNEIKNIIRELDQLYDYFEDSRIIDLGCAVKQWYTTYGSEGNIAEINQYGNYNYEKLEQKPIKNEAENLSETLASLKTQYLDTIVKIGEEKDVEGCLKFINKTIERLKQMQQSFSENEKIDKLYNNITKWYNQYQSLGTTKINHAEVSHINFL